MAGVDGLPTRESILAALEHKDFARVLSVINTALSQTPSDLWLLLKKAEVLASLGEHADAVAILQQGHRERPENTSIAMALARAFQAAGEHDQASAVFAAVLEQHPSHPGALRGWINTALALGDPHLALQRCLKALEQIPGDPQLRRQRARALLRAGRPHEALAELEALRPSQPEDTQLVIELAQAYRAAGDHRHADGLFAAVLEQSPSHPGALRGWINTALALGDPHLALQRCLKALEQIPGDPALRERHGATLQRCQRPAEAVQVFQALVQAEPQNTPWRLRLAEALRLSGDLSRSRQICEQILQQEPANRPALLAVIQTSLAANDPDGALRWCAAALQQHPGDPQLRRQRARALLRAGRAQEAVAALEALRPSQPEDIQLAVELGQAYRRAGNTAAAAQLLDGILRAQPQHLWAALARADLAQQGGDLPAALAVLERAVSLADLTQAEPLLLLRVLELAHLAGDAGRTEQVLAAVRGLHGSGALGQWSDADLLRLTRAAETAGDPTLAAAAIRLLLAREHLQQATALFLVRKAHTAGEAALAQQLVEALAERVPPGCRHTFPIEAALICQGPEAAYRLARATLRVPRRPSDVELLARLMTHSGRNPLARRYLGLCLRAWPQAVGLRRLFAEACLKSGRADQLGLLIDALEARGQASEAAGLRMRLLLETGALEEALALANEHEADGAATGMGDAPRLALCLSLGRLEEAQALAARSGRNLALGAKGVAQFSLTEPGRRLNELKLYSIEAQAGEPEAALAERFVFPAQQIVARWLQQHQQAESPAAGATPAIPRQIMQYWDSPEIPEELSEVMSSWKSTPGFLYTRLDRLSAVEFLLAEFGRDHARAFRLANSAAEGSDFLRLCWLLAKGGIYADADDKLIGNPADLLPPGAGLVLFREPYWAISNNLLCSRPGHPVIRWAVDMACGSLLERDNDSTWSKTGPGLLTRAVASYLAQNPTREVSGGICIRERHKLYPVVQIQLDVSYKSTPRYWQATSRATPSAVLKALSSFRPAPVQPAAA